MALQRNQVADGEQRRPDKASSLSRLVAVGWAEPTEVDAVAQHTHPFGRHPECLEPPLQTARNRDQPRSTPCSPADPPAWHAVIRDDIEIGAATGNDDRAPEHLAE